MAVKSGSQKKNKFLGSLFVNGVLILICLVWLVPTLGVFITSFREPEDLFGSGWWTIFPHRTWIETGEIKIDPAVDVNTDSDRGDHLDL